MSSDIISSIFYFLSHYVVPVFSVVFVFFYGNYIQNKGGKK